LFEFVARTLYGGKVRIATRAPSTESKDCVEVVRLDDKRDKRGVVTAEVVWIVRALKRLQEDHVTSVGVVTPFRAQADAIEEAVLEAFNADDLEALDLRVGTVHAFQGHERDVVIASLGIGTAEDGASWRFVDDPPAGLVADYLAQADSPPGPPKPAREVSEWIAKIAGDLSSAGLSVLTAYPTGRHIVDLCVDDARDLVIEGTVHADGTEAHIERHLALMHAGWRLLDAYPSRWGDRRSELIVELLTQIGRARGGRGGDSATV
jgi:very-short-patch-repair endonuclease